MTEGWAERLRELATEEDSPGAALAVWTDGRLSVAAHGVLNAATGVAATPDSLFQIGSITKLWTATMTGDRATLGDDTSGEEFDLYPADGSGDAFLGRLRDDQAWNTLIFGRLADTTRYLYVGGRITPRVG